MSEQQFQKGDWVRVGEPLGDWNTHFAHDCEAIVVGSYVDQYGDSHGAVGERERSMYTLHLDGGRGQCSWYYAEQLTLIERGRLDKLDEWAAAEEIEHAQKSDLDWIFAHGAEVLKNPHGATIAALAACFGLTNLWGPHGEGCMWYENARATAQHAKPFLEAGDKAGWLVYASALRWTR